MTNSNHIVKEAFYNSDKFNHYVLAKGKIESGHTSKEEADFHRTENLPKHLINDSKVISKKDLNKKYFDPDNKEHWAKTSDLKKESFGLVKNIIENNLYEFVEKVKSELGIRGQFVIENCNKTEILKVLRKDYNLSEMRDLPDNSGYPLSRMEVEKLLNTYERKADVELNDPEARSLSGQMRASLYPPEVHSDFKYDDISGLKNQGVRPAALMPYDKTNIDSDAPVNVFPKDYSGEQNLYFHSTTGGSRV